MKICKRKDLFLYFKIVQNCFYVGFREVYFFKKLTKTYSCETIIDLVIRIL